MKSGPISRLFVAAYMQTGSKSIKAGVGGVWVGVMCLYEGSVEMFTLMEAIMSAYSAALWLR